jgi:hypothetical protein
MPLAPTGFPETAALDGFIHLKLHFKATRLVEIVLTEHRL